MDEPTHGGRRRDLLIVDKLAAVLGVLRSRPSTPETRQMKCQARFYEQATKDWQWVPPSEAQIDAMFEMVNELHERVLGPRARPKAAPG